MGPQVQPKCFRHVQHMRNNWELRKRGYLIRFGHTEALLLKKMTLNGHFSRPAETDPYDISSRYHRLIRRCHEFYGLNLPPWWFIFFLSMSINHWPTLIAAMICPQNISPMSNFIWVKGRKLQRFSTTLKRFYLVWCSLRPSFQSNLTEPNFPEIQIR